MSDTLEILNGQGHLSISWDPDKPEEVAEARIEVERLKAIGYSFFLVDDGPADEVSAGHGARADCIPAVALGGRRAARQSGQSRHG